uniref:Uncharacterized protein n=1 Tax=Vespula pensylvanica TaxID=30213 RepID=A0A834P6G6_VESPE|nr:hypothetical protein H0235_006315 [Vespula pensylvanica]
MEECKGIEELSGFRALPATEGREVNTELPRKVHDQCNGYNHWVVGVPTYLAMWKKIEDGENDEKKEEEEEQEEEEGAKDLLVAFEEGSR